MLHDPETYENPLEFMPERYESTEKRSGEMDPHPITFGFGRRYDSAFFPYFSALLTRPYNRQCPGNVLAENTLWIATVCLFYAFKVTPAKDEKGVEFPIVVEYDEHAVRLVFGVLVLVEVR